MQNKKLIKLKTVMVMTSLSRSGIYKFMAEGHFPKQVKLSKCCVAWVESDVQEWIEQCIMQSR